MTRLSIIIPVSGKSPLLDDTLVSVLENRPADCEVLVVHDHPYQDPYNLSDEVRFVRASQGSGLAGCLNQGLAVSQASLVHVLACGVEVSPGWADTALARFEDPDIGSVSPVCLDRNEPQNILSVGIGYRIEGVPLRLGLESHPDGILALQQDLCGPEIFAAFYRRTSLEEIGGFLQGTTDMLVGVDTALALLHAGYRCAIEPQCLVRTEAALLRDTNGFRHGCGLEQLFWRWASSYGWFGSLSGHVALLTGQTFLGLWHPKTAVELLGRFYGLSRAMFARQRNALPKMVTVDTSSPVAAPHFALAPNSNNHRPSQVA